MMVDEHKVALVRQLLDQDISQREIHRLTGVSRDTIRLIFKGKWQMNVPRVRRPRGRNRIGRCPECGSRVRLPCLACRVRQAALPREHVA